MTNNRLHSLVPKLRFPEFCDAGEWEPGTLGQIGTFIGGGTPSTSIPEYWGGNIQWFTPSEINERNLSKSKRTITYEGLKQSSAKLLPTGALLITTRATIGDVGIADNPCATNQGFQSLAAFGSEVNVFWYYWLIQHKHELIRRSSGSTFLEIRKTGLKQIPILRPTKDEQQKIANCLGSLDDLIGADGRRIEALRQQKKGLMQQLFPQPGETMPKLRFPEFRNGPRWAQISLRDAFKIITNGQANAQDHRDDGTYPLFDRSEVVKRSPKFLFDAEAVILPGEGMRFKPRYFSGKFNLHQRVYALMEPTVNPRFAFYCLDRFKGELADSAVKSTVLSLRMPIIEKFTIPCPTGYYEQQKIADCLGSVDDLINAEGRKLKALRLHKQGLLQQLFPPLDSREL